MSMDDCARREAGMGERHIIEELFNIFTHWVVFPGDTISRRTAAECEKRGWIFRDLDGNWRPTEDGIRALVKARTSLAEGKS